jgi:dTDP-4-amino-4,6-dideoxygalactose transaminase
MFDASDKPYLVLGSPIIEQEEIDAVVETLKTAWIGTGPRVREFEEKIAALAGAEYGIALGSCTAALHLSMEVSGVGPGDEVITTPLTFAATAAAIIHTGARPVFVDCERDSLNIAPDLIEDAITERTKAIMPVHFAGRPCDMDRIGAIAKKHDLLVVEDAAHALEAEYKGRKVGSISPLTCFSFYVTKNITTAEGGMVTTNDPDLADRIKVYGLHGMSADAWSRFSDDGYNHYEIVYPGFKYNMTDIQAALGLTQLSRIKGWLARRHEIWARYDEAFADLPIFTPMPAAPDTVHGRHLYTPMLDIENCELSRDQLLLAMHERGIGTGVHYRSLHLHKYYRETFGFSPDAFPNAKWISDRTFTIPLSAKLSDDDAGRIIAALRNVVGA